MDDPGRAYEEGQGWRQALHGTANGCRARSTERPSPLSERRIPFLAQPRPAPTTAEFSFSDPKERLDALMIEELRKLAIERHKDPNRVALPGFVNHDIRRSVRTPLIGAAHRRGSTRGGAGACSPRHQGRL